MKYLWHKREIKGDYEVRVEDEPVQEPSVETANR